MLTEHETKTRLALCGEQTQADKQEGINPVTSESDESVSQEACGTQEQR